MHIIHGLSVAVSCAALVLLMFALSSTWYEAHSTPDTTKGMTPYAHAMDVHLSLWHVHEHHHASSAVGASHHKGSWTRHFAATKELRSAKFCPNAPSSPTNVEAHNEVAATSGLAILAVVLAQAYVVIGLIYAFGKITTRVAVVAIGLLAVLSAVASAAVWMHFSHLCGHFQCPRIASGAMPVSETRYSEYKYSCGFGLGLVFELAGPILILISVVLFAVKKPESATAHYEPIKQAPETCA